jgi:hypothetical protein
VSLAQICVGDASRSSLARPCVLDRRFSFPTLVRPCPGVGYVWTVIGPEKGSNTVGILRGREAPSPSVVRAVFSEQLRRDRAAVAQAGVREGRWSEAVGALACRLMHRVPPQCPIGQWCDFVEDLSRRIQPELDGYGFEPNVGALVTIRR